MAQEKSETRTGVVVLGPFRAGTSLVSQLLGVLGVEFGPPHELGQGDKFNPGGYFERPDVNHANGRLLETAGRTFAEPGDPATLMDDADVSVLDDAGVDWIPQSPCWGIKDPRMCATLSVWFDSGRLPREGLRIIHVKRSTEAVARSAERYPGVNHFFSGSFEEFCRGVRAYEALAQWQVDRLDVPTLILHYEELLAEPERIVSEMAQFVGVGDEEKIRLAASRVGKKKAQARLTGARIRRRLGRIVRSLTGSS
jgi:hypothetical protein